MTPFHALTLPFAPHYILQLARAYARNAERSVALNKIPHFDHETRGVLAAARRGTTKDGHEIQSTAGPRLPPSGGGEGGTAKTRLHVGYLSCDFGDHPVGRLFAPVPRHHSDIDVKVTLYALSADDGSAWRRHVQQHTDVWVDLSKTGIRESAQRIFDDGVHVLIDLMGYRALVPRPSQLELPGRSPFLLFFCL